MNGFTGELLAEGAIHELMLFHPCEIAKAFRHHGDLQMIATTGEIFDLNLRIRQGLADGRRYGMG